jgi:geranylgeranyl diphosphate synthase type I
MPPIFKTYKSLIGSYLLEYLESKRSAFAEVNDMGPEFIDRIKKMAVAGKTIRGSLVLLSYCFTNDNPSEEAMKAAAAMELFQTALVIHDDIMDKDSVRRGQPAMHVQYNSNDLAMCAGDVLFFLGFELLGSIKTDALTMGRIIRLVGREYQSVGIAQMTDISKRSKSKVDILSLYTYKTARYTFALPLMLGAVLAGASKDMLKYLESYGVSTGVIFQIRDDLLDHEKTLGENEIQAYQKSAVESIIRMPIHEDRKKILQNLLDFVLTRDI